MDQSLAGSGQNVRITPPLLYLTDDDWPQRPNDRHALHEQADGCKDQDYIDCSPVGAARVCSLATGVTCVADKARFCRQWQTEIETKTNDIFNCLIYHGMIILPNFQLNINSVLCDIEDRTSPSRRQNSRNLMSF